MVQLGLAITGQITGKMGDNDKGDFSKQKADEKRRTKGVDREELKTPDIVPQYKNNSASQSSTQVERRQRAAG